MALRCIGTALAFLPTFIGEQDWHQCQVENDECEDLYSNCTYLAESGHCFSDPAFMDSACRKSCKRCRVALPTACDANATCCKHPFSNSNLGCCPLGPNAVCCNGFTCCPEGTTCQDSGEGYSVTTKCVDKDSSVFKQNGLQICKPGPALPLSLDQRNCLVIGDSVSIGYTPFLSDLLNMTAGGCNVQHSPYAGDGGVEETAYGLQCLEYFLHGSDGTEILKHVDLIYFNWGLHNLVPDGGAVVAGQSGHQSEYLPALQKIVSKLVAARTKFGVKFLFGLTSPEMCDAAMDKVVQDLNSQAATLMAQEHIPIVDLHAAVVKKCGKPPQVSCLGETGGGCPHYSSDGYKWIANSTLAPAFLQLLSPGAADSCSGHRCDSAACPCGCECGTSGDPGLCYVPTHQVEMVI